MRSERLQKIFCLLVLFCFGLKNISYAFQPFNLPYAAGVSQNSPVEERAPSLLQIVASYVDLDLEGKGKKLFYFRVDKQRPVQPQFRFFIQPAEKSSLEFTYLPDDVIRLKKCRNTKRKFSLPQHHNFLFRLTPF